MLRDLRYEIIYSSGEHEPVEFFMDSLMESTFFDLGLGYFSTSGFRTLALGFAYFISKGGTMRIIINDTLSQEDKDAILKGYNSEVDEHIEGRLLTSLSELYETLSKKDIHFFNCISLLISKNKIDLKAIVPINNSVGIAHQKFGIFGDSEGDSVGFTGSANFSRNAFVNNIETVSCYKSWTSEKSEIERVRYFESLFSKNWEGKAKNARIIPLEKVKVLIKNSFPVKSIDQLLLEENDLIQMESDLKIRNSALSEKISKLLYKLDYDMSKPAFPKANKSRTYQVEALKSWISSKYIGFFEMATGTGKTITALNCALSLFYKERKYLFLVLVPTLSLASQWLDETEAFNFKNIIIANSENGKWAEECLLQINKSFHNNHFFGIITTYSTFSLARFQSIVNKLPSDTLLIADEAHNFGSPKLINLLPYKFKRRIGLSATPQRHFDIEGTETLLKFFNAEVKPTFKFDMQEAIEKGFLCEYYYYPKMVHLLDNEQEEYNRITKGLLKYFDSKTGKFKENSTVTKLFLERKRIIHKASNKKDCLRVCLKAAIEERGELKYTLVYVPEGVDETVDDFDIKLIDEYSRIISEEFGLSQHQFVGDTINRSKVLDKFSSGNISVLTAMKCLDEGVDVKRTETAIFCSSTGNPKQFIQRRGRILRTHKEKRNAFIYDMVVVPKMDDLADPNESFMEKAIFKSELKRVYEFASLSKNKYQSLKILEEVAAGYNIDIFSTSIA